MDIERIDRAREAMEAAAVRAEAEAADAIDGARRSAAAIHAATAPDVDPTDGSAELVADEVRHLLGWTAKVSEARRSARTARAAAEALTRP